jgi:hypothetical protein
VYSNPYCPFVKYHIYQNYPTLLDKLDPKTECGTVASTTDLSAWIKATDIENKYHDHWEYRWMTCNKKCNDDANCKRIAFGAVG